MEYREKSIDRHGKFLSFSDGKFKKVYQYADALLSDIPNQKYFIIKSFMRKFGIWRLSVLEMTCMDR